MQPAMNEPAPQPVPWLAPAFALLGSFGFAAAWVLLAFARDAQCSWMAVFAAIDGSGTYPLQTTALLSGSTSTASILAGGAAYLRFGVGAGRTASLNWEALPPTVTLSLVRLR